MKQESKENLAWNVSFQLPELPSALRYYDDFVDEHRSVRDIKKSDVWEIYVEGTRRFLDFSQFATELRLVIKHWCADQLLTYAPATTHIRFSSLKQVNNDDICRVFVSTPLNVQTTWLDLLAKPSYSRSHLDSLKSVLSFLCRLKVGGWGSNYAEFLQQLRLPAYDKYASVRVGDVFLSVEEEATLVGYIDTLAHSISNRPETVSDTELRNTAILTCSFQFGLRPKQIGRIQMRDVRIWFTDNEDIPSVHLTFMMAKQHSASKSLPMTRKVKREWSPLFVELYRRAQQKGLSGADRLFGLDSSQATASVIVAITAKLLPASRSATELRHTAAQRLVDAGASQEELAEFMGHSDLDTGLVYFQTSANQAERVNRALGISAIYQKVAKIAHDRFISRDELAQLKNDQQIAGVPHGIPISGIGGCKSGQPACPYNPVTSCYGCRKFMPIYDVEVHKGVLADFRSIVTFFVHAGREEDNSSAYMQLKRTISGVQSIIAEIEDGRT